MKILTLILVLALLHSSLAGKPPIVASQPKKVSASQVVDKVDDYIRTKYWYYLPNANNCYAAHMDCDTGFYFLHIYKNYVGTFLVISNYNIKKKSITVNTFVRLGDGYANQQAIDNDDGEVQINPFVVSVNLGGGEYIIAHDKSGHYNWNKKEETHMQDYEREEVHNRCEIVRKFIQSQYEYYLRDGALLDSKETSANMKCYCVLHYVSISGLYTALASFNYLTGTPEINTFVRTGDGYDPKVTNKCKVLPAPVENKWTLASA